MTSVGSGSLTPSPLTKWGLMVVVEVDGDVCEVAVASGNLGGDAVFAVVVGISVDVVL